MQEFYTTGTEKDICFDVLNYCLGIKLSDCNHTVIMKGNTYAQ